METSPLCGTGQTSSPLRDQDPSIFPVGTGDLPLIQHAILYPIRREAVGPRFRGEVCLIRQGDLPSDRSFCRTYSRLAVAGAGSVAPLWF